MLARPDASLMPVTLGVSARHDQVQIDYPFHSPEHELSLLAAVMPDQTEAVEAAILNCDSDAAVLMSDDLHGMTIEAEPGDETRHVAMLGRYATRIASLHAPLLVTVGPNQVLYIESVGEEERCAVIGDERVHLQPTRIEFRPRIVVAESKGVVGVVVHVDQYVPHVSGRVVRAEGRMNLGYAAIPFSGITSVLDVRHLLGDARTADDTDE